MFKMPKTASSRVPMPSLAAMVMLVMLSACSASLPFGLGADSGNTPETSVENNHLPPLEQEPVPPVPAATEDTPESATVVIADLSGNYNALRHHCDAIGGGRCCIGSVAMMEAGGFRLASNDRVMRMSNVLEDVPATPEAPDTPLCPEGMIANTLRCPSSYKWCEPAE